MNRISTTLRFPGAVLAATLAAMWMNPAAAQSPDDEYDGRYSDTGQIEDYGDYDDGAGELVMLSHEELDELVGPIALYPDDLLAIALPASTYPLDIVQAARFLDKLEQDPSLQPNEDWDESVTALLNYPEVVRLMNEDIDWTWELGGAVLNQQPDVIAAVERFRDRAYEAGNLQSDDYQTVNYDGDSIEILPADEQVIYVPYYEPRRVVTRQVERVYYYYPRPRPVYYYPYPAGHYFFDDWFWGVSTAYRIGWSHRRLSVWHYTFYGHPYHGRYYSSRYYRRPSINLYNTRFVNSSGRYATHRHRHGDRWRPRRDGIRAVGDRSRRVHRDYPQRRPVVRDRNFRRPARPATARDEIRFRDRPDTATAGIRRDTRTNRSFTEDIQRDRRTNRVVTEDLRRDTRTDRRVTRDVRQPNRRASTTRTGPDRPRAIEVRRPVERNADRPPRARRPATQTTRTRSTVTNGTPALRKPPAAAQRPDVRQQRKPAVGQQRRPDDRGDRSATEQRQSQRSAARQRTESSTADKPGNRPRKHRN